MGHKSNKSNVTLSNNYQHDDPLRWQPFCKGMFWGACGPVDRALDLRSEGLGFDSQCWTCVEVSGKLRITHCLGPPSHNGYLVMVHRYKVGSIVAGCIGTHLPRGFKVAYFFLPNRKKVL